MRRGVAQSVCRVGKAASAHSGNGVGSHLDGSARHAACAVAHPPQVLPFSHIQ